MHGKKVFYFLTGIFLSTSLYPLKVLHLPPHRMDEMEDAVYASFVERNLKKAQEEKFDYVLIEINTPGGELSATFQIKDVILQSPVPTVCFINSHAISAGSLVALSCEKLYMAPQGVIGAATPVTVGEEGMKKAPEKVVSAARANWRATAEARGRNPQIAEAFVDEKVVLTQKEHGIEKKKGVLLTLSAREALRLGIADGLVKSVEEIPLWKNKGVTFEKVEFSFKEKLLAFLLHPIIAGILLGLGFLGLVIEIRTPGWGIPGTLGLLFLAIYFTSRIALGISGWGAPALFALGVLLLLLEIFVIPGFGFAGITGLAAIIFAIMWSYGITKISDGLWVLTIAFALLVVGTILFFYFLPKFVKTGEKSRTGLFLSEVLKDEKTPEEKELESLVGQKAYTITPLRPAGVVVVGDKRYDALTRGEFLEKGQEVEILAVEHNSLVVRAATSPKIM